MDMASDLAKEAIEEMRQRWFGEGGLIDALGVPREMLFDSLEWSSSNLALAGLLQQKADDEIELREIEEALVEQREGYREPTTGSESTQDRCCGISADYIFMDELDLFPDAASPRVAVLSPMGCLVELPRCSLCGEEEVLKCVHRTVVWESIYDK
jgi:hypothetical protein